MMEYVTAHVIIRFHKGTSSVVFDGFFSEYARINPRLHSTSVSFDSYHGGLSLRRVNHLRSMLLI